MVETVESACGVSCYFIVYLNICTHIINSYVLSVINVREKKVICKGELYNFFTDSYLWLYVY